MLFCAYEWKVHRSFCLKKLVFLFSNFLSIDSLFWAKIDLFLSKMTIYLIEQVLAQSYRLYTFIVLQENEDGPILSFLLGEYKINPNHFTTNTRLYGEIKK